MKRLILITIALLSCAFTIVTPEMVRDRERVCERIRRHYGEAALTTFVKTMIERYPEVDGVSLSSSKVDDKWETLPWNPLWHVISGDWAMVVKDEKKRSSGFDRFTLFWKCDEDHGIFVEGHREKTGELLVDSICREETIELNWM